MRVGYSEVFKRTALCAGLLSILILASCARENKAATGPATPPPAPVKIAEVKEQTVPVQVDSVGSVEAFSTIAVKAQVSGELTEVAFKEGEIVEEGQKLFTIDPRPFEVALEEANANLAKAEAQLQLSKANVAKYKAQAVNARAELERNATLLKKGMCSQSEYDQSRANAEALDSSVAAEEANINSANEAIRGMKAAIASANLQLDYCFINSPIKGKTGSLLAYRGNIIKPTDTTPLVTITQTTPIYVSFTVPERNLWEIREHMAKGTLEVTALVPEHEDVAIAGQLTFIDNQVNQETGTIRLKATFANEDGLLWPGQYVKAVLKISVRENAIVVPSQAVQVGQDGQYAYVVTDESKAELRRLTAGETVDGTTVIEDGLKPGEKVIIEGHLRVAPGGTVKIASENNGEAAKKG